MKTSKWLAITLAASLTAGGLTIIRATAQNTPLGPSGGLRFLQNAKKKLGLTDDQAAKIKAALAEDKDKLGGLLSSLHESHIALRQTVQRSGATEADIRAASAKVASVEADFAVERARLFGKIGPILDSEQMEKVNEFQERVDDFIDGAIAVFGKRLTE